MYDEKEIEDSLEFCKQIEIYKEHDRLLKNEVKDSLEKQIQENEKKTDFYKEKLEKFDNGFHGEVRPTSESTSLKAANNVFFLCACCVIGFFVALVLIKFVAYPTVVEGQSMEPTLSDGDYVLIQKVEYYINDPDRFDVIVFPVNDKSEYDEKEYYVKRIIGLPGENIQIKKGAIYINEKKLLSDKYSLSEILEAGYAGREITLKDNEYFVLGDNRNMSTDSRSSYVGLVKKEDIKGKVLFKIWPFNHFSIVE